MVYFTLFIMTDFDDEATTVGESKLIMRVRGTLALQGWVERINNVEYVHHIDLYVV